MSVVLSAAFRALRSVAGLPVVMRELVTLHPSPVTDDGSCVLDEREISLVWTRPVVQSVVSRQAVKG